MLLRTECHDPKPDVHADKNNRGNDNLTHSAAAGFEKVLEVW
jgi:hypothetical protein